MSTIGNNILKLRKQLGWTQEELAQKMGYSSKSAINKIELGKSDIPQSKIVRFAEVLGTTPSYLMGWVTKETDNKNSQLVELTIRLRKDVDFANTVSMLNDLSIEQYESVKQLLLAFTKQ